jgi:hypothetical protein
LIEVRKKDISGYQGEGCRCDRQVVCAELGGDEEPRCAAVQADAVLAKKLHVSFLF